MTTSASAAPGKPSVWRAFAQPSAWTMFFFGFAMLFIVTQMHGLGLSRGVKALLTVIFGLAVAVVYSQRGLANLNEIIRIPLIDYLGVFVLAGLIGGGLWIARKVRGVRAVAQ